MTREYDCDVLIIGAGPAGALAAASLVRQGRRVLVLEKEAFPRFSIGESLLPQSMGLLEQAGLLQPVVEAGFQYKNGAVFARAARRADFDFRDKHSDGWGSTYQVQRSVFDKLLADSAASMGAEIRYQHQILEVETDAQGARVIVAAPDGSRYGASGRFLLDASGFGRVLPRLLALERPSSFPKRKALFTHVEDAIDARATFDRTKILITVHPEHVDVWYWLIPFSDGRASLGVVADQAFLDAFGGDAGTTLRTLLDQDPGLHTLLKKAVFDTPARAIGGYAADVTSLHGPSFALLGNAGEFLDPVFSSGATIAFKSASLACAQLERSFRGEAVDWEQDYAVPLRRGVDTFRAFVESWYRGGFQEIIFYPKQDPTIRRMICAILAGYAWDTSNPYVAAPRHLKTLEAICSGGA